jgi:Sas10 C-terminal domain/Sas10/Utp3/C1D family
LREKVRFTMNRGKGKNLSSRKNLGKQATSKSLQDDSNDSDMYDEVDTHFMKRNKSSRSSDVKIIDGNENDDESDENLEAQHYNMNQESVMDIDFPDDDEDDEDLDESDEDEGNDNDEDDEDDDLDDREDEETRAEKLAKEDAILRRWGKSKSMYHGNEAAVEDDDEAAAAEEEEAIRLQKRRAMMLSEEDIVKGSSTSAIAGAISGKAQVPRTKESEKQSSNTSSLIDSMFHLDDSVRESIPKDASKLSKRAKLEIIQADAPELFTLLQELQLNLKVVRDTLRPILQAKQDSMLQANEGGMMYLQIKQQLLLSYVSCITFYLLLKAEGKPIKSHPVIEQLVHVKTLLERLQPYDVKMQPSIQRLLRQARQSQQSSKQSGLDTEEEGINDENEEEEEMSRPNPGKLLGVHGSSSSSSKVSSKRARKEDVDEEDDVEGAGDVYVPVRHSAVSYETDKRKSKADRQAERSAKRLADSALLADLKRQFGEAPEEQDAEGAGETGGKRRDALDKLDEERTAFEEDAFTRVQMSKAERKARKAKERERSRWSSLADLEQFGDVDGALRELDEREAGLGGGVGSGKKAKRTLAELEAGLKSSSAANRTLSAVHGAYNPAISGQTKANSKSRAITEMLSSSLYSDNEEEFDGHEEMERGKHNRKEKDIMEEDPFYAAVAAAAEKKRAKKVESQLAREEERVSALRSSVVSDESNMRFDGKRKVSREILKNRGLVKYRNPEDANPRVHYRKKAEKAMKRLSGARPAMRDSTGEADSYGGEASGIRTNISRSRKIKS